MVVAQLQPMVCLAGRWGRAVVLVLLVVSTQCCLRLSFCCRHLLLMNLFGEACESRCGRERRCPLPNKKGRPEETGSAHVSAGSWLSRSQFLSGSLAFGQLCSPCVTQNHATHVAGTIATVYPVKANCQTQFWWDFLLLPLTVVETRRYSKGLSGNWSVWMNHPPSPLRTPKPMNALSTPWRSPNPLNANSQ